MDSGSSGESLPSPGSDARKRRVSYFYEPDVGDYYYGDRHVMKPRRIRIAHNLVVHYNLFRSMEICRPFPARPADLRRFHSAEYVEFLSSVSPGTDTKELECFNLGGPDSDCPVFDGMFDFSRVSAGGSLGAAAKLNTQDADIAINWAGGMHHAKKSMASGFCYVNDIVLGILELLKVHRRVLYIDIDVHHGDGVEEAFYRTDRVMTLSFHKYGEYFFPQTGDIKDIGQGKGKNYSLNVPLSDGLEDEEFESLFRPIIQKAKDVYQPEAIVLQCGADSLADDALGSFNLTVKGHAKCVRFVRSLNLPLMLLGGGGYKVKNVARCWCYETAVAVDVELDNELPFNDYFEYFGPKYLLHEEHEEPEEKKESKNEKHTLDKTRNKILEMIGKLPHAPSVQFKTHPATTSAPVQEEPDMEGRSESDED